MGCKHNGRPPTRLYDPAPLCANLAHLSSYHAAAWLGIDPGLYRKYRAGTKWLRYNTADKLAMTLGLRPQDIWPDFGEPCCSETTRQTTDESNRCEETR